MNARRTVFAVCVALAFAGSACTPQERCQPGTMRSCTRTSDAGITQSGYQSCEGTSTWAECVPVGACTGGQGLLPVYSRCVSNDQCGPTECAVCGAYSGVQNANGNSVCYPFCSVDTDCRPTTTASGIAPRCVLGQCMLLCLRAGTCPNDSQCMPWNDPSLASMYPAFDGLCD